MTKSFIDIRHISLEFMVCAIINFLNYERENVRFGSIDYFRSYPIVRLYVSFSESVT